MLDQKGKMYLLVIATNKLVTLQKKVTFAFIFFRHFYIGTLTFLYTNTTTSFSRRGPIDCLKCLDFHLSVWWETFLLSFIALFLLVAHRIKDCFPSPVRLPLI